MSELDHKKFDPGIPKVVKREVILNSSEEYIAKNWHLLEKAEKDNFKRMLSKAFDYVFGKIDARKKKED